MHVQAARRAMGSPVACAVGLVAMLAAAPASGEPATAEEQAAAQVLFDEGRELVRQGRAEQACPKFEESQRLDPGVGTQFNLADCYERVGRNASAWSLFLGVAAESKAAGRVDREQVARARAERLEPELLRLTIMVNDAVEGLEVLRDGVLVGSAQWGAAVPVDPGTHRVMARAPGHLPWETTVTVARGSVSQQVQVPRLEPVLPPEPEPLPPVATPAPATPPPVEVPPPDAGGRDYRSVGFVLGGAGVVALGIGAYFGVRAWQKNDESSDHCDGDRCFSQTGVDLRDEARSAGNSSTVLSVAGGALLASGVTLVLLSPAQAESSSLHASAVADSTRATLSVGGTF